MANFLFFFVRLWTSNFYFCRSHYMFWSSFYRVIFLMWLQECIDFAQIWKELQNQKVVVFYPRLQRWVDQINLLNVEWFALWNIMCVDMHHTHSDRKNILFLLRSCMNAKRKTEGKVSMMHIILITDFGLNHCDNLQKERTSSNQCLQEME